MEEAENLVGEYLYYYNPKPRGCQIGYWFGFNVVSQTSPLLFQFFHFWKIV